MAADVHTEGGPGAPDCRSPGRFIWWLILAQRRRVAKGATIGTLWMVGLTVPPYLLSRAIDDGLQVHHTGALVGWTLALFGVGVANAWLAIMRHRTMTWIRLDAAYRTEELVVRQACRLGGSLRAGRIDRRGRHDRHRRRGPDRHVADHDRSRRRRSRRLRRRRGAAAVGLTAARRRRPGRRAGARGGGRAAARPAAGRADAPTATRQGGLAARLVDIVGGLRVLNGLGGKDAYAARYRRDSQALRREGYRVGAVTSWIQALGIGLPDAVPGRGDLAGRPDGRRGQHHHRRAGRGLRLRRHARRTGRVLHRGAATTSAGHWSPPAGSPASSTCAPTSSTRRTRPTARRRRPAARPGVRRAGGARAG